MFFHQIHRKLCLGYVLCFLYIYILIIQTLFICIYFCSYSWRCAWNFWFVFQLSVSLYFVCVCVCVCTQQSHHSLLCMHWGFFALKQRGRGTCAMCDGNTNLVLGQRDVETKRGVEEKEDGGSLQTGPNEVILFPPSSQPPFGTKLFTRPPFSLTSPFFYSSFLPSSFCPLTVNVILSLLPPSLLLFSPFPSQLLLSDSWPPWHSFPKTLVWKQKGSDLVSVHIGR